MRLTEDKIKKEMFDDFAQLADYFVVDVKELIKITSEELEKEVKKHEHPKNVSDRH